MHDKLYSRRRIRIQVPRIKKCNKVKLCLCMICLVMVIGIISCLYMAYPIFKASCETAASSTATNIVNNEVINIMKDYTYNDLVIVEKDVSGNVKLIQANIIPINQIISKTIANIQNKLDHTPRTMVFINMGSVTGFSSLTGVGPKFDIELETAGMIVANIKTEFESVGINQTLHKIYLNVNTKVGILTPMATFNQAIQTDVLLAESVIVGEIPNSYYDFHGITDSGEVLEMIE